MASGGGASVRVKRIVKKGLRSIERSSKLLSHERCSVSRPGSERSGNRVHPRAHRRPSQGKPSRAVVEAVYGVAMGATERRTVRRDRSRASAQPSPLVSNRASGAAGTGSRRRITGTNRVWWSWTRPRCGHVCQRFSLWSFVRSGARNRRLCSTGSSRPTTTWATSSRWERT